MIVGENIFVMLLTEAKFRTFTPKQICDATRHGSARCLVSSKPGRC